jgi:hypothetical protein
MAENYDPSATPTLGPRASALHANLQRLKVHVSGKIANLQRALKNVPKEGPSSRHPFDVNPVLSYRAAQRLVGLRLRLKSAGKLPPHTPSLRLPQAVLKPPVVS